MCVLDCGWSGSGVWLGRELEAQREMSRHYVTSFDIMQLTKALIR